MIQIICYGLAAATILLSFLYTFCRNKFGEKVLWLKILVSLLAVATAVLMFLDIFKWRFEHYAMLAAIVLCLFGDIAIGVKDHRVVPGIAVFSLAQIAICIALSCKLDGGGNRIIAIFLPVFFGIVAITLVLMGIFKVSAGTKVYGVIFYLVLIAVNAGLGFATLGLSPMLPHPFILPLGTGLFYLSDLLLGYGILKKKTGGVLSYICLFFYFSAIAVLALSLGMSL